MRSLCSIQSAFACLHRRFSASTVARSSRKRVLFFGSDQLSVDCLRSITQESEFGDSVASHVEVLCPADSVQQGKQRLLQVPLKQAALASGLTVHEVPSHLTSIKNWAIPNVLPGQFDLAVVVSFGYFIPSHILKLFPSGAINVHPSLLPRYRGPAPIYHTLMNGDLETGVSIIEVDEGAFDVGAVLAQEKHTIDPDAKYNQLLQELSKISCTILPKVVRDLENIRASGTNQKLLSVPTEYARAPKVKTEMGLLDWKNMTGPRIYGHFRAFSENIGAFTFFQNKRVKVLEMTRVVDDSTGLTGDLRPASFIYSPRQKALIVSCKDQTKLFIGRLQVEGRKALSAVDFANGFRLSQSQIYEFNNE